MRSQYFSFLLLILSLIAGMLVRISNWDSLEGNVIDPDSARYLRQAEMIIEKGGLPEVDTMRRVPLGINLDERLTIFPYTLAGLFKFFSFFFNKITLEQVAIFSPILFAVLGGIVLYMLINRIWGVYTALLCVNISIIAPPWVNRTVIGYADRDGLCLLLTLLGYYFYVRSIQTHQRSHQYLFAGLSGLTMMLLGLTWEGAGLSIAVILGVELFQLFFFKYNFFDVCRSLCWSLPIVAGLSLLTNAYHNLSQPFVIVVLGFPFIFCILILIYLVFNYSPRAAAFFSFRHKLPLGALLILSIFIAASLILFIINTPLKSLIGLWEHFVSPFGQHRLQLVIGELQTQGAYEWFIWPGLFFAFSVVGFLLVVRRFAQQFKLHVFFCLILFEVVLAGTILSRILSGWSQGRDSTLINGIYAFSLLVFLFGISILSLYAYWQHSGQKQPIQLNKTYLFLLTWFLIMLFSSRSAARFNFFFTPICIAMGSWTIVKICERFVKGVKFQQLMISVMITLIGWEFFVLGFDILTFPLEFLSSLTISFPVNLVVTIGCTISAVWGILIATSKAESPIRQRIFHISGLCFLTAILVLIVASPKWIMGFMTVSHARTMQQKPLITPSLRQTLQWIETQLPSDAVIAASWEYGSFINLLANRSTVVDEEQLLYWIHLMSRHAMLGQTDREALEFFKAHNVTHLMLTVRDLNLFQIVSFLGSDEYMDRHTLPFYHFGNHVETIQLNSGESCYRYLIPSAKAKVGDQIVSSIYLQVEGKEQGEQKLQTALVELDTGKWAVRLCPEEIYFKGQWIRQTEEAQSCTLLVHTPRSDPTDWEILYIPPKARKSLMIRLYLFNQLSEFFTPVYPIKNNTSTNYEVRLWEIHYPPDLEPNPLYLETEFPNPKFYRSWMKGGN